MDQVSLEECKEADSRRRQAMHKISRGLHNKVVHRYTVVLDIACIFLSCPLFYGLIALWCYICKINGRFCLLGSFSFKEA